MIAPFLNQSLPLDIIKDAPPAAAYALRKLKSGYKGAPIRVRRSNDDAELDIPFCGQYLCIGTLMAFVTTNSGFVVTVYDQSGNGNHATQTTAANQPRIVNAGVLDIDASGKPTMVFDGTNDVMTIANSASVDILSAPLMMNAVFNNANQTGYIVSKNLDSSATVQYALAYITTSLVSMYLEGAITQSTAGNSAPINTQLIDSHTFTTAVQKGYINGVNSGSDGNTNTALTSRANMQIGARSNNAGGTAWASFFKGNISEIIILTSTSGRSKLERSQSKYYQVGVA